jgi:hypothetical protein
MPAFAPRSETIKKEEQLSSKRAALEGAIKKEFTLAKLTPIIEKYRLAQISLFKAQIHQIQDKNFANKIDNRKIAVIEGKMKTWESMTIEEVLSAVAKLK